MISGGFAEAAGPTTPAVPTLVVDGLNFPAAEAPADIYQGFKVKDDLLPFMRGMQADNNQHQWDMQLMSSVSQGAGDLIKTMGWVIGMGMKFNSDETINDRRMDAQENIASFQQKLGLEYLQVQDKANDRAAKLAPELKQIEANTALAIEKERLESRERREAMEGVDRAFDMGNRRSYFDGNPFG